MLYPIRKYQLDPFPIVTDCRTGISTTDAVGVLSGNLDQFMREALMRRVWRRVPLDSAVAQLD